MRAAPVIVERCRGGEVWQVDASAVEPLRQSLASGIVPPESDRLVTVRERAARVLVVAPFARRAAQRYAAQVRAALAVSAGAPVQVSAVWGADTRLAFRAARELDRRPALAVLVAPAGEGSPAVQKVYAMLRSRRQEAVASGPLPATTASSRTRPAAVAAGRLPVSWLPDTRLAGASGAGSTGAAGDDLAAAARDNVQTLVRACWPGALAPRLRSSALGFTFIEARHTGVGVVGASEPAVGGGAAAAAPVGLPGRPSDARRRRLAAAGARAAAVLPPGLTGGRRGLGGRSGAVAAKCRQS